MPGKSKRKQETVFTYSEKNGDLPIEEWLIPELKEFAKQKYGISLNVWIKEGGMKDGSN
ncbi:hypothetical protein [Brevibacillus porteri]|uniref:hypothetical protein n=1 Tax=Brevibacillus porteri TaxID=2126350 RepID=UPI001304CC22|nr:hypothetical protein [Brevibacillus porteri]MED1802980.1 hypothetical protein [Brevibacillus porteri]MED2134660.1 hypothetical protein [Brevibacillus porteri]MED2748161.1 hypothetical protein [Brevibacillus porteri]MED2817484.1 hypothetical protein [Brevibacillus porteri]MED2897792.1 hypothetical protein [Brevibacillus porteri]